MPLKGEPDPRWVEFGSYLEKLRRDQSYDLGVRLTQKDIAAGPDVTLTQYGRIVRGESGTEQRTIIGFAQALQLKESDPRYAELFRLAGFLPPAVVWQEVIPGVTDAPDGQKPDLIVQEARAEYNPAPDMMKQFESLPPDDQEEIALLIQLKAYRNQGKSTLRVVEGGQHPGNKQAPEVTLEPIDQPGPPQEQKAASRGQEGPKYEREAARVANEEAMRLQDNKKPTPPRRGVPKDGEEG